MEWIRELFGIEPYDFLFVVGIILLPVTVGGFWAPILTHTFKQTMVVIACSIVVNIIWLYLLKALIGIEFNTEAGAIARVITLDISTFAVFGILFCVIAGGPYEVEHHPPDPLNRFDISHPDRQT